MNEKRRGHVDMNYVTSKKWSSALDFENNDKLVAQILLDRVFVADEVEAYYSRNGLMGPFELSARRPVFFTTWVYGSHEYCDDCVGSNVDIDALVFTHEKIRRDQAPICDYCGATVEEDK